MTGNTGFSGWPATTLVSFLSTRKEAVNTPPPPRYFATLQAFYRPPKLGPVDPKDLRDPLLSYRVVQRDNPVANEFRVRFFINSGERDIPLGNDRERAEMMVHALNQAFEFGKRHSTDPRQPILTGRMGYYNRQEELMP